jgi:hypothetical protein
VFTDDFAYDRSHNVRPRRNIRQAMQHGTRSSPRTLAIQVGCRFIRHSIANYSLLPSNVLFSQRFRCMLSRKRKETDLTRQWRTVSDVCTSTCIASLSLCNPNLRFPCVRLF